MSERQRVLDGLMASIAGISIGRPVRVAVDGRLAAGKTRLADELAALVQRHGRAVIRTSIDGFHRPRAERYARGRYSGEGYYYDSRDLDAVMNLLLVPLGPGGDRRYRTASFDLENDRPVEQPPEEAPVDAILIVDGTFLQRPELRDGWDVTLFVETSEAVAEQRGVNRDAAQLGGVSAAARLYAERYRPAFALYKSLHAPAEIADAVLDNNDLDRPTLVVRPESLLVG